MKERKRERKKERKKRGRRRNNHIYLRVGWLNFKDDEKVKMNGKDK